MSAVSDLFDPANRPECGSWNGYCYHQRHNESVCQPCHDAMTDYRRALAERPTRRPNADRAKVVEQMKALDAHRASRAALREQTRVDL